MLRRDTENKDIEHQESDRELITINEKTNSLQAISQNGAVREIVHYLFWQPTCIHFQTLFKSKRDIVSYLSTLSNLKMNFSCIDSDWWSEKSKDGHWSVPISVPI
jgi:hypothetical protein